MSNKKQAQNIKPKKSRFTFFQDVYDELKKVTWPSRRDTIRLTWMVIAICAAVGIVLGGIDLGFTQLMKLIVGS